MRKRIFQYFNGEKNVWADPLKIDRQHVEAIQDCDFNTILKNVEGPEFFKYIKDGEYYFDEEFKDKVPQSTVKFAMNAQSEALEQLFPILYKTFGLKPIDPDTGEGCTEFEILDAWKAFSQFQDDVKKNTEQNPNSQSSIPESNSESTEEKAL